VGIYSIILYQNTFEVSFFFLLPLFAVSQYALSTASIRRVLISYSNAFFQSQLGVSFISQITPAVGDTLDRW